MQTLPTLPLSLYIHIPWCIKKCPYCDFNSHTSNSIDEKKYLEALMADLDTELELTTTRPLQSIFFGGGTPSLFSPNTIHKIIEGAHQRLTFDNQIEITMEANPGTFEQKNFAEFKTAGINRLSIGIQSFNDQHLKNIGRIHDAAQALGAINTAQEAGFDNINLDLMFGLPGQKITQAINDIEIACNQNVQHLSYYQLTIEANTFFHAHPPAIPNIEDLWDMQIQCHNVLLDQGFLQYEVSAFSKPDQQCRHNLNYWNFGDYIGIGAGAHGKLTNLSTGEITRRWKRRHPEDYMKNAVNGSLSGQSKIKPDELIFEFLLNALRLKNGFSYEIFEYHTGLSRNTLIEACQNIDAELLIIGESGIRTSDRGYRFLNDVLEQLI
ncbi:MAG: radical SAM family heme chaperone HemW [Gammaproteobacteria bacterium]|nr:radical SAM family heme chaperone HemW [Gammaproteobacteria bacterium]